MIYGLSDLHLDYTGDKSMEVFGSAWENYEERMFKSWKEIVKDDDYVVVPGDISWALKIDEAYNDLKRIESLPGKKIFLKGNHDLWWSSLNKIKELNLKNVNTSFERSEELIKNNREIYDVALCRGVANLRIILEYMIPFIKLNGRFLPQKLNLNEIEESKKALKILNAKINNIFEFKLPENEDKRIILEILKLKKTSEKYPRKTGIPAKKPL